MFSPMVIPVSCVDSSSNASNILVNPVVTAVFMLATDVAIPPVASLAILDSDSNPPPPFSDKSISAS